MKRELDINLPNFANQALKIVRCNAFKHPTSATELEVSLDATGVGSIELEVLEKGSSEAYLLKTSDSVIKSFWIFEGDEPIRLENAKKRVDYPAINGMGKDDKMDILNFNNLLNRFVCGDTIVSEEEKRILCDYFEFANNSSIDKRMCEIDKGVVDYGM